MDRKIITVPTGELAAVAKWAHEGTDRPRLHMVRFSNDEYAATDGHRMVRVPCKTHGLEFGVDRRHLLAAVGAQRALLGKSAIVLEPEGKNYVRIELEPGFYLLAPMRDATIFPRIDAVMPKAPTPSLDGYHLDTRFLADIAEVDAANSPGNPGIRVEAWSPATADGCPTGALLFRNRNGVRFVVMPMRGFR